MEQRRQRSKDQLAGLSESVDCLEADFIRESEAIFCILFKGGVSPALPLKSPFSPVQEKELRSIVLQIVRAKRVVPEEDRIDFYFSGDVLSSLLNALRYENPYGTSLRSSLLESLASYDPHFAENISHRLSEFLLQYVMDERASDPTEGGDGGEV